MRALIVDDEPPARARLRRFLEAEPDVELIAECASGPEAVETIMRTAPHVVFLDVQMPVMNGFDVLAALPPGPLPAIIFVTAYDEYALRAFEVHAVDYLLKPYSRERLREALACVRARSTPDELVGIRQGLLALAAELRSGREQPGRIAVRADGRVFFISIADIDWVEAAANYVRLHARGEAHVLRESMKNMEMRLPTRSFLRIHRSTIVNIDRIRELQPWFHGEYIAILYDGTKLTVSRAYVDRLHELID
jgi:two-component system LytT family response regulator